MIDNQQVKYKIIIPFSASRSFAVPVSYPLLEGGVGPKNGSPAGPISGRWSVPHTPPYISPHISPHVPHIPTCPSSQHIPTPHQIPSLIPSPLNNLINFIIFAI